MYPREGAEKQIEMYKSMTGMERLRIAFQLWEMSLALMRANEKFRNPTLSDEEIEKLVRRRVRLGAIIDS
jgi:hypothetical protein